MLEKIKNIICNYTEVDPSTIIPEASIRDLGLNSYDLMNIVVACEDEFSISIPDRDIHSLVTVGDIVSYLEKVVS